MNAPSWFHVFDSTNRLWMHEGGKFAPWGGYEQAAEFESYESAHAAALDAIKHKGSDYDGTVVVLADYGTVEAA